jgi:hypothetical protein
MVLLNIYIATVIFAIVTSFLLVCETKVYCKEHKITRPHKLSLSRRLMNEVKMLLMCIIPLYNILVGIVDIVAILHNPTFEAAMQRNLDNGTFIKREENENASN